MRNITGDVTSLGCFKSFNTVSCVRDSIEAFIAVLTAIFCIYKILKLFVDKLGIWDQYLIFTLATAECILCAVNWLYAKTAVCDYVAELLKLMQFLIVCCYYCQIACRVSKREYLFKRRMLPALGIVFIYFIVTVAFGIVNLKKDFAECTESEWLQLSISEIFLGLLFVVAAIYITRKLNVVVTEMSYKKQLRIEIWGIVVTFLISALCSISYDVAMLIVGADNQCKGVFISQIATYTAVQVITKIFKWLLPIWAMLIVFRRQPFTVTPHQDEESEPPLIRNMSDEPFLSKFRSRGSSFHYKHLRNSPGDRRLVFPVQPGQESKFKVKKSRRKKHNSKTESTGSPSDVSSPEGPTGSINESDERSEDTKNKDIKT